MMIFVLDNFDFNFGQNHVYDDFDDNDFDDFDDNDCDDFDNNDYDDNLNHGFTPPAMTILCSWGSFASQEENSRT